ncbi:MAG: cobyric acid synthase [Myxococcota bacterium]
MPVSDIEAFSNKVSARGEGRNAPVLMIQGTASDVGKSLVVAALCRIFKMRGWRVAPFKAQNMALNSAVTSEGHEIGRAQAMQAVAAGVLPHVDMNPILLKPEGELRSQLVVLGTSRGVMSFSAYRARHDELAEVVLRSLDRLRRRVDLVVAEGAGSPAEINLRDGDLVNMFVAKAAQATVLLVGDIDRGGVFASLLGTLKLLSPDERALVQGLIVNKFRGDPALFETGIGYLEKSSELPVLGVLPYLPSVGVAEEDSVALERRRDRPRAPLDEIEIAVVRLPHLSNYDDVQPLEAEPGVLVRFVDNPRDLFGADLILLPGSKKTVADLAWLRATGFADAFSRVSRELPIIGICGGCQMLGEVLEDPEGVESAAGSYEGLGLLPLRTRFGPVKRTTQVIATPLQSVPWMTPELQDEQLHAYEIHHGRSTRLRGPAAFCLLQRHGTSMHLPEGSVQGRVVGTMLHGFFDESWFRGALLHWLSQIKGASLGAGRVSASNLRSGGTNASDRPAPKRSELGMHSDPGMRSDPYDDLARSFGASLDIQRIEAMVER